VHLTSAELVLALDRIGIVAFAFSGVELGARRRFDLFGLLVMGTVTATGGGALRDIALGRVPFVLAHADYIAWAVGASGVAIVLTWANRTIPRPLLAVADAAGLGAFAVAGALAGIQRELPVTAVLLLGILTATGGGVIRDVLADRVPLVLRTEVNATAAALGAFATWAIEPASNSGAALAGVAVAAAVRLASLAFDIHLPVPGRERTEL
jgi:uncharacterized membrane protein YeiH